MKNINLYRKILRLFILLGLIYVVYSFIYHIWSASKLVDMYETNIFKIGKILNISEDRIKYFGEYNFKDKFFSSEGMVDDKYYFIVIRVGNLKDKYRPVSDVIHISSKPFSTTNQEDFFTRNDFISKPSKSIHAPYLLSFNTRIFPVELGTILVYTKQNMKIHNSINNDNLLELTTDSNEISFSFNNTLEEDITFKSYRNQNVNLLIYKDNNDIYLMILSSRIDIIDRELFPTSPPLSTISELKSKK
jgi:hypothetical protein